jgi:hypothetical protein
LEDHEIDKDVEWSRNISSYYLAVHQKILRRTTKILGKVGNHAEIRREYSRRRISSIFSFPSLDLGSSFHICNLFYAIRKDMDAYAHLVFFISKSLFIIFYKKWLAERKQKRYESEISHFIEPQTLFVSYSFEVNIKSKFPVPVGWYRLNLCLRSTSIARISCVNTTKSGRGEGILEFATDTEY